MISIQSLKCAGLVTLTLACSTAATERTEAVASHAQALLTGPPVIEFPISGTTDVVSLTRGPDGALWFVDQFGFVDRVAPDGTITYEKNLGLSPTEITLGGDGAFYLTALAPYIVRLTINGSTTTIPIPSGADGMHITTGADGSLWFTEGKFIGHLAAGESSITEYPLPDTEITAAGDGGIAANGNTIWFSELAVGRVGQFDIPSSTFSEVNLPTHSIPIFGSNDLAIASDDSAWLNGPAGILYQVPATLGSVNTYSIASEFEVSAIVAGADHALWFIENQVTGPNSARIGRMTLGGALTEYGLLPTPGGWGLSITNGFDGNVWFVRHGNSEPNTGTVGVVYTGAEIVTDCSSYAGNGTGNSLGSALATLPPGKVSITFECGGVINIPSAIQIPTQMTPDFANQEVTIQAGLGLATPVELNAGGVDSVFDVNVPTATLNLTSITVESGFFMGIENRGTTHLVFTTIKDIHGIGFGNLTSQSSATIDTSTIVNNTSTFTSVSGVYNEGTMLITASTIANNTNTNALSVGGVLNSTDPNATLSIVSTILSSNIGTSSDNCGGLINDMGYNLEWGAGDQPIDCAFSAQNNDVFADPLLSLSGVSDENPYYLSEAAQTWDWAIGSTQPAAYNNGALSACNGTDTRGWERVHACTTNAAGLCCSIGAYEPDNNGQ